MQITVQIIIAALSLLGLFFAFRVLASLIFTSRQITAAVVIENERQLGELDMLLNEASSALYAMRRRRLSVFVQPSVWNTCDEKIKRFAVETIEYFGAELYLGSAVCPECDNQKPD